MGCWSMVRDLISREVEIGPALTMALMAAVEFIVLDDLLPQKESI